MTTSDIQKPDDRYNLIGGNWPSENESGYNAAVKDIDATAASGEDASGQTRRDSIQVGDEFKGETGEELAKTLNRHSVHLDGHTMSLRSMSTLLTEASGRIAAAKTSIKDQVEASEPEIKAALAAEAAGRALPDGRSSASLIETARSEIAAAKKSLYTQMEAITSSLEGHHQRNQPTAYTRTPDHATPAAQLAALGKEKDADLEERWGVKIPEPKAGDEGQAAPDHRQGEAPTAPSGVPTTPLTNTSPVSQQAQNGVPSTPLANSAPAAQGHGGMASTPLTNSSPGSGNGAQHNAPSSQGTGREAPRRNASSTMTPLPSTMPSAPINAPVAAPITRLSASESPQEAVRAALTELRSDRPVATMSNPVATTPLNSTPPVINPSSPVAAPPAVTASNPTILAPVTPPSSTPQATSLITPAPQPEKRSGERTDPGAFVGLVERQREEKRSPEIERPETGQQAETRLFTADLPPVEALAHEALSTLRSEFERVGWDTPLAVAVTYNGSGFALFYATGDAISIWPGEVQLPHAVWPLAELIDTPRELLGHSDPTVKLALLGKAGLKVEATASTHAGAHGTVQTPEQHQQLQAAENLFPPVRRRGEGSDVEPSAVTRADRLVWSAPRVLTPEDAAKRLRALRWADNPPPEYAEVLADWQVAEVAASLAKGALGSALYVAEQALVQSHNEIAS